MAYSAVSQPLASLRLRRCGGSFGSTLTVACTRVCPSSTSAEPSAWMFIPVRTDSGLSSRLAREERMTDHDCICRQPWCSAARIECVPQGVTQQVEAEYHEDDRQAGEGRHVGRAACREEGQVS